MFTSDTSNSPGGLTNASAWQTMAEAGTPDPTWSQMYYDDFMQYLAAQYSVVGTGTPVVAQAAGKGGLVNLLTTAAAGDTANLQLPVASYQATPGKHLFFKALLTPVSTAATDLYAGLFPVGANPLAATDFIGFVRLTGSTQWTFRMRIASVNTDTLLPATLTTADGTALELGFHIDTQGNVELFWNPSTGNVPLSAANAAVPGQSRGRVASFQNATSGPQISLTQVLLAPTVGIRTTGAAARNFNVDYLVCSAER
jgi:hypothetical protein